MTDPRIEAAARELKRLFSEGETSPDAMWLSCAKCVLDAADAAAWMTIDTAPEEGHMLICFENGSVFSVYRILGRWFWCKGTPLYAHRKITHWMPFPEPPCNDTP